MGKGGGGGGQQQAQPTTQTVQQTNLPSWAQPYSEKLLGKAEALTDINTNPYQSYSGQRLAGFTPMQQQAFGNIGNMGVSEQTGMGTGLAGLAGLGGLNAQNNYTQTATSPGAMAAYMSPYMQNVVDWQKQQAINDYGRALPGLGAAAAQRGAFGGSRQALVEAEAQRNLQNQLAGIQATGTQNAFQQAQQAQQFGAGLGMQGLGLAGQAAGQLGQLGQQQYGQQMGINAAQQQAGAQQQAMEQQGLTNQYQDFLNKMNYPYQQLSFMSDILHGTPTGGITTSQQMQAQPSMANQIMGYGLGAYGLSKMFGAKEGGFIKGYKRGGEVKGYAAGGAVSLEAQYRLAQTMSPEALQAIVKGQPSEITAAVAAAALPLALKRHTAAQGIEAEQQLAKNNGKSVIDRMLETQGNTAVPFEEPGVTALNSGSVGDVAMAEGGIIGFNGQKESFVDPFIPETEEQLLRRRLAIGDITGAAANALAEGASTLTYPGRAAISNLVDIGSGLGRMAGIPVGLPERQPTKAIRRPVPQSQYNAQDVAENYVSGNVAKKIKTTRPTTTFKGGPEELGYTPEQLTEITSRAQLAPQPNVGIGQLLSAQAPAASRPSFDQEMEQATRAANAAGQYAAPEMQALKDLISKRRQASDTEAAKRKDVALGGGLVAAAAALLQSGQTRSQSLGQAMSALGKAGMEFSKDEQRIKDKLDEGDLALAQANLSFKKGNYESGLKLLESFDKRSIEAAKVAGDQAYQDAMTKARDRGLSIEEAKLAADNARYAAMLPIEQDLKRAHARYYNAVGGAAGQRGGITQTAYAQILNRVSSAVDKMFDTPVKTAMLLRQPEYKGMTQAEVRNLLVQQKMQESLAGLGGLSALGTSEFKNPAFGEGAPPEGVTVRPLVPAKP